MIAGLLLAAGSGRRFGGPKALADTGDGPWVLRALDTLAGLAPRFAVLGAAADEVRVLLPDDVIAVPNPAHASGMGSSLVAGLRAIIADQRPVDAVCVMLVDLPDVPRTAVERLVAAARDGSALATVAGGASGGASGGGPDGAGGSGRRIRDVSRRRQAPRDVTHILARAAYRGRPGHPVLIGSAHFTGVIEAASGDRGARDYLARHEVGLVECGDLAGGADVDELP